MFIAPFVVPGYAVEYIGAMWTRPSIAALLAGQGNACLRAEASPDGRHAIIIEETEVAKHWLAGAALYSMPDESLVAPIAIDMWSAERINWTDDGGGVSIELRRYPGDVPGVTVKIDLNRRSARIDGATEVPLAFIGATLEADYQRRRSGKGSSPKITAVPMASPSVAIEQAPAASNRQYEFLTAGQRYRVTQQLLTAWSSPEQAIYAVYPTARFIPAKVRAFVDFVAVQLRGPGEN